MKVGIVGAGNVATHLVKGLQTAGVELSVVYSRTLTTAQVLVQHAPAAIATTSTDFTVLPAADVYLLAVPDQALAPLLQYLKFPAEALVAHTSGTQPLNALAVLHNAEIGVFYPLQTFSKEKDVDWRQIPICVEASTNQAEQTLMNLGRQLSNQVTLMNGDTRRQLHVAAVFACNFTNHLWGIAQELLQKAELPLQLLEPLVQETVQKAFQFPPFMVQTGPAQRRDNNTIQAHLQLLESEPHYRQLYQTLTQSIQTINENETFSGKQA